MKTKRSVLIYPLLYLGIFLLFASGCKKDVDLKVPTVLTVQLTEITQTTALSGGDIADDGGATVLARGVCWGINPNPTVSDSKTEDGNGSGAFTSSISGLGYNTKYYVRAYAITSNGAGYGDEKTFTTYKEDAITDIDGNYYNIVTIGNQQWLAENLKTTHYANGTAIPLVTGDINWSALAVTSKAYCWSMDDIANKAPYGALYTWTAAMNGAVSSNANPSGIQGVCPTGWHLPSDAEWTQMENYLADNGHNYDGTTGGGRAKIAKSLANTSGWSSSSDTGSVGNTDYPAYRNKSGFSALPGGLRFLGGNFLPIGYYGYWWCSTDIYGGPLCREIFTYYGSVNSTGSIKEIGFSVRCVRD